MEQATHSSCEETMEKDEAGDSRGKTTTTRMDGYFETCNVFETLSNEETSIVEACVIEEEKECQVTINNGSVLNRTEPNYESTVL